MPKMESKKLQTRILYDELASSVRLGQFGPIPASDEEKSADARIAHEQRKVIRELERELKHLVNLLRDPIERYGEITVPGLATLNGARAAISAAAPYIQED